VRLLVTTIAWMLLAAIFVFTDGPLALRPETGLSANLERFVGLFVVGVAFALAYPRRTLFVVGLLVVAVLGLEYLQHFIQNRHGTVHDAAIKCCGAFLGVIVANLMGDLVRNA
jgi:VanZ family protein